MGFFIFTSIGGFIVILLLIPFSKIRFTRKVKDKLEKTLKWNGMIRLILEGALEISFTTVITIRYVQLNSFGGYFNYIVAWILFCAVTGLALFIVFFYTYNFSRMSDKEDHEFHGKYEAAYEGLKTYKKLSLFQNFWMCTRRFIFVVVVLHAYEDAIL